MELGIYPEGRCPVLAWTALDRAHVASATILAFSLGFPLAYAIAFRGGAYKNLLLFMVIAPFFTSFLLRTISWKIILSDDGLVLGPLKAAGILPADFQLLATPAAVIAGITYNFGAVPVTSPLYVSLRRRSTGLRLIGAASWSILDVQAHGCAPTGSSRNGEGSPSSLGRSGVVVRVIDGLSLPLGIPGLTIKAP